MAVSRTFCISFESFFIASPSGSTICFSINSRPPFFVSHHVAAFQFVRASRRTILIHWSFALSLALITASEKSFKFFIQL